MALLSSCNAETLFQANFNSDAVGSAPSASQIVGTVSIDPGGGAVKVVAPLPGTTTPWVEIGHPTAPSPQTAMQCRFSQFRGEGTYTLLTVLFIPGGAGVSTVQFERFGQPVSDYSGFLHLDFLPNNTVRVDDGASIFGTFPRDQFFTLSATLEITASSAVAHLQLFGTGATGALDYTVNPGSLSAARQFGAVRFWIGFQHAGRFAIDEVLVTRKTS